MKTLSESIGEDMKSPSFRKAYKEEEALAGEALNGATIKMKPTTRAMVDVGRKCNINCKFCYHKHLGDLTKQTFLSAEVLKHDIDAAAARGNDTIDFSGGEPTIHPDICELIRYCKDTHNMKVCIITNAILGENSTAKILDAGVDEFLVSMHGLPETHDMLSCHPGARDRQERFLKQISKRVSFRINYTMNKFNQDEISVFALYAAKYYNPSIMNFINFNPHHSWQDDVVGTKEVLPSLDVLEKELNLAIPALEKHGIGVNVRYYPMCRIKEEYRRCVCNDHQVTFDPYEWDYRIMPKTVDAHMRWAIEGSKSIEHKKFPCSACNIRYICGGINRYYYKACDKADAVKPVYEKVENEHFVYHYRQHNDLTIGEPNV